MLHNYCFDVSAPEYPGHLSPLANQPHLESSL